MTGRETRRRCRPIRSVRAPTSVVVMVAVSVICVACVERSAKMVFAAASLSDALLEIGSRFETATGLTVDFNFAGSNVLARQIEAGAPADLFLSADLSQVERLEAVGALEPGRSIELLTNQLAVVVPVSGPSPPGASAWVGAESLLSYDRLAMADPTAVPAGMYARRWLETQGLWRRLAPRIVPGVDVRASLAAVAAGDVPVGIVYATDAASSDRVRVVHVVPADEGPPIRYYLAVLVEDPTASLLAAFFAGPEAREVFVRHGFAPLPPAGIASWPPGQPLTASSRPMTASARR